MTEAAESRPHNRKLQRAIEIAVPVAAAVAVSQTWFRPSRFLAQGDIPPFIRTSLSGEYPWPWNHDQTGAGSRSFQIVRGVEVLVIRATDFAGGSETVAQRVFYAILFAAVALGTASFARCFTSRRAIAVAAALFGFINPFVLTHLPNPVVLTALAFMGIGGSMIVKAGQGAKVSLFAFALSTAGLSYLMLNIPVLIVAVVWLVGLVALGDALCGPGGSKRALRLIVLAFPLAIVINLWWLIPALSMFFGDGGVAVAVEKDIRAWGWTHARGSIANLLSLNAVWAWSYPEYFPYAPRLDNGLWGSLRFVPPLVCLSAPVTVRGPRQRTCLALLAVILLLVLVGKGLHPPASELNLWLYDHVPGMWLLREPFSKVGPLLVLVYVALIAFTMTAVLDRIRGRSRRARCVGVLAVASTFVALFVYPYPLWNGNLFPDQKPGLPSAHVQVPVGWQDTATYLNRHPDQNKSLVLPLADFYQMPTTWGYYGADVVPKILLERPTIQLVPQVYFSAEETFTGAVYKVQEALLDGRVNAVPPLLRQLGVSHVLLRRDLDLRFPGRTFVHPSKLAPSLSKVKSLSRPKHFGVADVYSSNDGRSAVVHARELVPQDGMASTSPSIYWTRRDPTHYEVKVAEARRPFMLVLTETYDAGWRLTGLPEGVQARHVRAYGYANAWRIEGGGDFRLAVRYQPAKYARLAQGVSILAFLAGTMAAISRLTVRVFRRRMREKRR